MHKFLGNYKIDFDIELDELKFNSHKVTAHNDKDSENAKSVGYGDNTEFLKVWGEDYPQYLRDYVEKFPMKGKRSIEFPFIQPRQKPIIN